MSAGLKRYQRAGHLHFVTFCCYRRALYLESVANRELFEDALERIRARYEFEVVGYVVMPDHVHLLLGEPACGSLARGVQALKLSVARRSEHCPFWEKRYYDFNVFSESKRVEKLEYIHWNPVRRGLVENVDQWRWSSYGNYSSGGEGHVKVSLAWSGSWWS
jgi:REP-associated tyrosine transposase